MKISQNTTFKVIIDTDEQHVEAQKKAFDHGYTYDNDNSDIKHRRPLYLVFYPPTTDTDDKPLLVAQYQKRVGGKRLYPFFVYSFDTFINATIITKRRKRKNSTPAKRRAIIGTDKDGDSITFLGGAIDAAVWLSEEYPRASSAHIYQSMNCPNRSKAYGYVWRYLTEKETKEYLKELDHGSTEG